MCLIALAASGAQMVLHEVYSKCANKGAVTLAPVSGGGLLKGLPYLESDPNLGISGRCAQSSSLVEFKSQD